MVICDTKKNCVCDERTDYDELEAEFVCELLNGLSQESARYQAFYTFAEITAKEKAEAEAEAAAQAEWEAEMEAESEAEEKAKLEALLKLLGILTQD